MNPTRNDLSESTRSKISELCNERLADAIDLQTQCKYAHWNVKGANFIALHELGHNPICSISQTLAFVDLPLFN